MELCGLARAGGTRLLFATPHAHAEWDHHPLTLERERLFEEAFAVVSRVVTASDLDLRRGWEVFPTVLRERDPHEFLLEGTRAVLLEFPGSSPHLPDDSSLVFEAAERLQAVELVPVIAHPERSLGLRADFGIARALVERGCLLCPNADSALGDNGPLAEDAFWRLLDEGWSRSSLPTVIGGSGRRGSIRRIVCLSNATERPRSRCCSTDPPCPGSERDQHLGGSLRDPVAVPPEGDKRAPKSSARAES